MEKDTTATAEQHPAQNTDTETVALAEAELLVEEISIDGMCGVY
jgi:mycofactocin precursor